MQLSIQLLLKKISLNSKLYSMFKCQLLSLPLAGSGMVHLFDISVLYRLLENIPDYEVIVEQYASYSNDTQWGYT